jgi:hypothetical protein
MHTVHGYTHLAVLVQLNVVSSSTLLSDVVQGCSLLPVHPNLQLFIILPSNAC